MPDRPTPDPVALAELAEHDGELAALRAENARLRAKCGEPEPTPMQIVDWWSEAGTVGSERKGTVEVAADASDEEIEEEVRAEVFNRFEWGWTKREPAHA